MAEGKTPLDPGRSGRLCPSSQEPDSKGLVCKHLTRKQKFSEKAFRCERTRPAALILLCPVLFVVAGFLLPVLCEKGQLRVARSRGSQVWPGHHTGTVDVLLPGALHCSVSPSHLCSVLSWGPSRPSLDPVAPMLRSHPASPSPHRASPTTHWPEETPLPHVPLPP